MICKRQIITRWLKGFSLLELMVGVAAAMVLILGIGGMMAHSQQGFTRMYRRAHSNVVEDAYSARRVFDRVVRKSTMRRCDLISDSEIYVYYYSDTPDTPDPELCLPDSDPDSCARFYVASGTLYVAYSKESIAPGEFNETLVPASLPFAGPVRLARNVQTSAGSPIFSVRGRTVRMAMLLDNESECTESETWKRVSMMVTSSAVRHNR